jgi:hypothetical protein
MNIIKYELYKRNKASLSLFWDLNARPHEITLLKNQKFDSEKNMEREKFS